MELTSAQINLSWFCDFHGDERTACPYCWVTMAQSDRSPGFDHSAEEWLDTIKGRIPATALLDFVGGEPTVFPYFHWLVEQLSPIYRWSVTSNLGGTRLKLFCESPIGNCLSWTASYHHTSRDRIEDFARKCRHLARHYPLRINVVDYPGYDAKAAAASLERALSDLHTTIFLSPFEDVRDLNTAGPVPLTCNGGHTHHILIDPEGYVYKCLTHERRADRERWRLGNLFAGDIAWPTARSICFVPCDQYYILNQKHATRDMWQLDVRELELPDGIELSAYRSTFEVGATPLKQFIEQSQWRGRVSEQARGDLLEHKTSSVGTV